MLIITGPTGTGKSGVALALAESLGHGEIVNADAYQIYAGLDILTAKPSPDEQARVPHHLFSLIPPSREFNAAQFQERATACLADITARHQLPIVVGGTGLYVKTLTHGLSPLPESDPALRAELDAIPLAKKVAWLNAVDPQGAAEIDPANPRYVQRALEISLLSGQPASTLKTDWKSATPQRDFHGVLLLRDRDDLYQRINCRVEKMFAAGLLDEVRALGPLSATAEKAIGIREARRHLAGEIDRAECIHAIQQATRHYAKRQITWFKKEKGFHSICLAPDEENAEAAERILKLFPELRPSHS